MSDVIKPLVSVVIPTYNHAHFLGRALKSVLAQTYTHWEAIVIDNHSQDNTEEVIGSFQDPRIRILKIHNHGVIAASRNAGISAAHGEWIAFLDSDDLWYPKKLEVVLDEVGKSPSFDVYSTDELLVNEITAGTSLLEYGPYEPDFYEQLLVSGNCLSPSAALVSSGFLTREKIMFRENPEFVTAEDYDLWLLLARSGARFRFIRSLQGEYRIHASNSSGQLERHGLSTCNVLKDHVYKLQSFHPDANLLWRKVHARLTLARFMDLMRKRQFVAAAQELVRAFCLSPIGATQYFIRKSIKKFRRTVE